MFHKNCNVLLNETPITDNQTTKLESKKYLRGGGITSEIIVAEPKHLSFECNGAGFLFVLNSKLQRTRSGGAGICFPYFSSAHPSIDWREKR